MIIGIDASRANLHDRTGTEWYSFFVIQELKKIIPADIRVVLYSKEPLLPDLADLPKNWQSRVLGWPPKLLWTQLRVSLEMLLHKPDLLYVPAHTIPLIHPKKVVVVVHDVGFARQDAIYNISAAPAASSLTQRLLALAARIATLGRYGASEGDYHRFSMDITKRAASKVITISEFSRSEIASVYPELSDRLIAIPNGVNPPVTATPFAQLQQQFGIRSPYVLFSGRIELKKNIPRLIDAFATVVAQHPNLRLVLAGKPGFGYDQVTAAIERLGMSNQVILTGWVDEPTLQGLRAAASVVVLPSLYEGFGIPVVEAMQSGVPVVCSDIPALREVAGSAALFFPPTDTQALSAALHTVLQDQDIRTTLINAGTTRVRQFSWQRTAQATWGVLGSMLKQ